MNVIFQWNIHSGRTMVLGLAQPLTETSTRNISCGSFGLCRTLKYGSILNPSRNISEVTSPVTIVERQPASHATVTYAQAVSVQHLKR
jgi:hypothetical protein